MVFYGKRRRQFQRRLVACILPFVLFLSPLSGQEGGDVPGNDADSEEPRITLEISPEKIIVGQRFDLTIFADFPLYRSVKIKEPELPEGITLASGPYKSAQTVRVGEPGEARYIKKTRIFYKYKVTRPGIYELGEFSLTDGENSLNTEPVVFAAVAYDERSFKYPVFARWNEIPEEIMVGETIPLVLKMENLEALSFPDRVDMTPPVGGMFERVNSLGEIVVTAIGEDEVFIAPIDSWLYTPTAAGTVRISGAHVTMGDIKRSSPDLSVKVIDIPEEINATGAIGTYEISTKVEDLPVGKGRVSTLRIRVEGQGNLNYLEMPAPLFTGLTVIEKEELNEFIPSESGYSGYREDIYRISAGDESEISIQFEPWSWYDRSVEQVRTETLTGYRYQNEMVTAQESGVSLREEFDFHPVKEILEARDPVYNIPMYYLLLLPGVVSVAAALIRKRYDMKITAYSLLFVLLSFSLVAAADTLENDLKRAEDLFSRNDREGALEIYADLSLENDKNPALFYNTALINYDLERKGEAVYNLRKALNLKPGNGTYRSALLMMEEDYGLEHQVRSSTGLSPDLFFLLFILLFNGGALLISFNIRKRKMELSILVIMIFLLSLLSLGSVYYSHAVSKSPTAVVSAPGGDLKKVPGDLGGSWLTLQEGTAVLVLSRSDDSVLIRTGYGLEGWLPEQTLLFLQDGE